MSANVQQVVTDRILAELKKGAAPWVKPWRSEGSTGSNIPQNAVSRRAYSGTNVFLLWIAATAAGYPTHEWLTFKQAQELGGTVRRGEKSTAITYMGRATRKDENGAEDGTFSFLKTFAVFNVAQCDGLPVRVYADKPIRLTDERCVEADEFVASTGAEIETFHIPPRAAVGMPVFEAFYVPSRDVIGMPAFEKFISADHFYATEFHELGHWTGHKSRLDRDLRSRDEMQNYALEELVAELTSAFLCAEFGFDGDVRHAGYIQHWIKLLETDNKAFMKAASAAQKAVDYVRGLALASGIAPASTGVLVEEDKVRMAA